MKNVVFPIAVAFMLAILAIPACSRTAVDESGKVSLARLIEDIDANRAEHVGDPSAPKTELLVSLNRSELELLQKQLDAEDNSEDVRTHLETWRDGLEAIIEVHLAWIEEGRTRDDANQEELDKLEDALRKKTDAENRIRILLDD